MERVYTHVSPEHLQSEMAKRTSQAFAAAEDNQKDSQPTPAVREMSLAQIKELSRTLVAELARRKSRKC
jgi:hypothetical protein